MITLSSAYLGSRQRLDVFLSKGPDAPKNVDRPPRRGIGIPIVNFDSHMGGAVAVYIDELVDALNTLALPGLLIEYEQPVALPTTPGAVIETSLRGRPIRFIRSGGPRPVWINTLDDITRSDRDLLAWFSIPQNPSTFTVISD